MGRKKRSWGWAFFAVVVIAAAAAGSFFLFKGGNEKKPVFILAKVERGSITCSVSSTGTLNAVTTVTVGSQVSGQIKELFADFNSEVSSGQIVAKIDPENFEARVGQAEAELSVARANVAIQRASVERSRAELQNARASLQAEVAQTEKAAAALNDAKRALDRKKKLRMGSIISESEIDGAVAFYDQASAQMSTAEAQQKAQVSVIQSRQAALDMAIAEVEHALAQVKQREAALHQSKVDLAHTIIRSPVDGVVIERSVDIGQTVAASLQAPTLFTIARDLRKMQVDTSLDEADIGRIQVSQEATFTVDAFPGKTFRGEVVQIRKAPFSVQNVVTYTVVVSAENSELKLLPGMTANVQILVDRCTDAVKAPNGALRFQPAGGPAGGAAAGGQAGGGEGNRQQQAAERLRRLTEALNLTEEQQNQIRSTFAEMRNRVMTLRGQGASQEEIREQTRLMREKNQNAVVALLNPEQREKYRLLMASRSGESNTRGRVWTLAKDGTPTPVDLVLGISDGIFTEVVRGDLSVGQEVVIGVRQTARKSPPAAGGGGGRFGF
ncbi:MAG: efflux RND transporter periplasmic adaptor subunit [Pseudomonadota bacterium]